MSESEGRIDCAEYVLGTLTFDERVTLEGEMARDPALRAELVRWEDWLAGLNDAIPTIAPAQSLWPVIERRLQASMDTPTSSVVDFIGPMRRSRARWRAATVAFAAMAAGLALFVGRGLLVPAVPVTYLAVVDRGGALPALIVHVDIGTESVSVRSLAAETPPDRVLQLWYISGTQAPRSIGLLDGPLKQTPLPEFARTGDLEGSTLAVSVEPKGGSPTGAPTGQVIYSGKLIRDQ